MVEEDTSESNMKHYHLKWASHLPNMGQVFSSLYQSEGLADVTLACCDGTMKAHKLLLSTCSDYFLELFLENSNEPTMLVMPDVKESDLRNLLMFIYTGEINVNEDDLSSLLEVAESLGVRGLKPPPGNTQEEESFEMNNDDVKNEVDESSMENTESGDHPTNTEPLTEIKNETASEGNLSFEAQSTLSQFLGMCSQEDQQEEQAGHVDAGQDQEEDGTQEQEQSGAENPAGNQVYVKNELPTSEPTQFDAMSMNNENIGVDRNSFLLNPAAHQLHPQTQQQRLPLVAANPLTSMSNLAAAVYQHQNIQEATDVPKPIKPKPKPQQTKSPQKKILLDMSPDQMASLLSQVTSPICPVCQKDCINFPNLRSHIQVHSNAKPFECNFCDAKFARLNHLNRHVRSHTGEKPYGCERCGKRFGRQDKLKVHIQRHLKRGTDFPLTGAGSQRPPGAAPAAGAGTGAARRPRKKKQKQNANQINVSAPATMSQQLIMPQPGIQQHQVQTQQQQQMGQMQQNGAMEMSANQNTSVANLWGSPASHSLWGGFHPLYTASAITTTESINQMHNGYGAGPVYPGMLPPGMQQPPQQQQQQAHGNPNLIHGQQYTTLNR